MAEKLGQPLMPWQQMVADVGLELTDEGLPAYREVIVTIPRQNGKTTLVLVWELDRCFGWGRRQSIAYTAQTGKDAREKLLDEQVPMLRDSAFAVTIRQVRRVNGSEAVFFKGGSRILVVTGSEGGGHGKTLNLGVLDEAWKDADDRREQAMLPAMNTVADAQLLVVSTMGTDASIYLNRKVETGRASIGRSDANIAYFEWSADHEADPDDPATWYSCMPALGLTIGEPAIKHARATMEDGEFFRAYLNWRTASDERVISAEAWDPVCAPDVQPDGKLTFAIDCSPDRAYGAIAAADRNGQVELVDHDRGTGWLVPRAVQLAQRWGAAVALDPAGPAGSLRADLECANVKIIDCGGRDLAHACGAFYDAVADQTIRIRTHEVLNVAVAAAKKRPAGDAWVWSRKDGTSDITALVAVTIAYTAARRAQGAPHFYTFSEV